MKLTCLVAIAALVTATGSFASERNDIVSCYDQAQLSDARPAVSGRLLTVVVDQTLPLSDDLQRAAWGHIARFVKPGDEVKLYSFSSLANGNYMRLHYSGKLDGLLTESARNDINMTRLRRLDNCLKGQMGLFTQTFGREFVQTVKGASLDHPKTEIIFSLRAIAGDLQRSQTEERVVFILSDMMENSDYTSLYGKNKKAANELKIVEDRQLFTDLGGARVYVLGVGYLPDQPGHYYPGEYIDRIKEFWSAYFENSNASLEGFGTPNLGMDLN
ncbi:hypothetical protein GCM10011502_02450 [Oceanisphaera marina]|uniref:VWFA domain-containing protein n=1 Tax=Oceanisphaera marina TaxID=2017550 RepID=A0ABQ1ICN1_9GAMM|nr:hypothetical protein [Oceanisphaera marina]GGB32886.1 hypothetical protein GCM10011502_02450 [Oceanisphaera marina]